MEGTQCRGRNFFSFLYRTRFIITRKDTTLINLSLLFSIIVALTAPWLAILGLIMALVMGSHFAIDPDGLGFEKSFDDVIRHAAGNVKHAVETVTKDSAQDAQEE